MKLDVVVVLCDSNFGVIIVLSTWWVWYIFCISIGPKI